MARTPAHPGEVLADERESISLSAEHWAILIMVPPPSLSELGGQTERYAGTALRLGRFLGTSAQF